MTERPLLLVDVDGVLNPWKLPVEELRSSGFQQHHLPVQPGPDERQYKVWLNPLHGQWLRELRELGYELAWCTTWWRHADEIAERVGLPLGLPALPLPPPPAVDTVRTCWKTTYVREYAAARRVAWLDDDVFPGNADVRALTRTDLPEGHPLHTPVTAAKLVTCRPEEGLTRSHVDELVKWYDAGCPTVVQAGLR